MVNGNQALVLIVNGFKILNTRITSFYFQNTQVCKRAIQDFQTHVGVLDIDLPAVRKIKRRRVIRIYTVYSPVGTVIQINRLEVPENIVIENPDGTRLRENQTMVEDGTMIFNANALGRKIKGTGIGTSV